MALLLTDPRNISSKACQHGALGGHTEDWLEEWTRDYSSVLRAGTLRLHEGRAWRHAPEFLRRPWQLSSTIMKILCYDISLLTQEAMLPIATRHPGKLDSDSKCSQKGLIWEWESLNF